MIDQPRIDFPPRRAACRHLPKPADLYPIVEPAANVRLTCRRRRPILLEYAKQPRTGHVADIVILGGPNGAGKTTAAATLLRQEMGISEFVNADEIARGMSPFNADAVALRAGAFMIERIQQLIAHKQSFAFETTCAGRVHLARLKRFRAEGWGLMLLYLWLPSPQAALDRVARRVQAGGHGVPDEVVIRRYWAGLKNMRYLYLPLVHVAAIYDNSDGARALIAERTPQAALIVHDAERWGMIERATS
jgi:predicted ABC-type ATPase